MDLPGVVPVVSARGHQVIRLGPASSRRAPIGPDLSRSPEQWRDFYEQQGRDAMATGQALECSTGPIIDVVLRMTGDPRWTYESVLDVGCGANAPYVEHLESLGKHVVGLDFAYHFVALAKQKGQTRSVQGDATSLPFPDASFDAIICSETLEHVPDDRGAVAEIHRVLRPGGLLFLTVPNYWHAMRFVAGLHGNPCYLDLQEGHLREYNRREVDRLLGDDFRIRARYRVPFLWRGILGGPLDALIRLGVLARFSVSIALVAERVPA